MTVLHLSTIFPRSPSSLQSYIANLSKVYGGHGHTFIFALSANFEAPSDLAKSVQSLDNFIGDGGQTVGCLSSPFNGVNSRPLSCSFGVFESPATTFRSVIPGKAEVQVGRWHSFRKKEEEGVSTVTEGDYEEGVDWEDVWDRSRQATSLPEDLQKLDSNTVNSLIYFTDTAPEGLCNSFQLLPKTTKLGLTGAPTPFITGRPVTLFHNGKIHGSGAVGVALSLGKAARMDYLGVKTFSKPVTITSCEGNLVNTINNANPTKLLLSDIRKAGLDGSGIEQYSLGVVLPGEKIGRTYRITSGDPSRGSLALDSQRTPDPGTLVQFLHRPKSATIELPQSLLSPSTPTLGFLSVSESPQGEFQDHDDDIILSDTFLAASEKGVVLSPALDNVKTREDAWVCSLAGGLATLDMAPGVHQ
ncbi:hypothetical protein K443DRAFT_132847 [Laccaria amethystina LaAM-08-1]|uniref:FIST domain-containing protein n=1 Tax=Laccaria amethystina LaAM-08-1 TaxID=1095629 RepID=A0A0C9WPK6_9AGAR|nr:hypothetical protein K443DRAFT_132847 [Laccaria amethystina LaAM-08-1]